MADECSVHSFADILSDVEHAKKCEALLTQLHRRGGLVVPRGTSAREERRKPGRRLLGGCAEDTRTRYETLLEFEELPWLKDFGLLIAAACPIVEAELDRLLVKPAQSIVQRLIASLEKQDHKQAAVLQTWAAQGFHPTTMGTEVLVLLALRRGVEQGDDGVRSFLASSFRPRYHDLVRSKDLIRCLDTIRAEYRNRVSHTPQVFDVAKYEHFTRLAVANQRFAAWDAHGPDPIDPEPSVGILHHHLHHSHLISPMAEPPIVTPSMTGVDRLLALRTPAASRLGIDLKVYRAAALPGVRAITVTPAVREQRYRLGEAVRFGVQANERCHIALLDIGTSGAVTVLWPNARSSSNHLSGGRPHYVPRLDSPEFEFTLTGEPGQEHVVALARLRPLAVPLLPDGDADFRSLTAAEVIRLVEAVERLDPAEWAVASCSFEIMAATR
jgi:hypothetical protein